MKELIPEISRVAVLGDALNPGNSDATREAARVAEALGLRLQYHLNLREPKDIVSTLQTLTRGKAEAILGLTSALLFSQRKQLTQMALNNRLPAVYGQPEYADDGGMMAYGTSIDDLYRRAAAMWIEFSKGRNQQTCP
jgi:putative tryptophan/tyrosine transport system substrate-binding protein